MVTDKATAKCSGGRSFSTRDEGNRPDTTLEGLSALKPVIDGGSVSAAIRASFPTALRRACSWKQRPPVVADFSHSASIEHDRHRMRSRRNGYRPVHAIPQLLKLHGLRVGDIGCGN